ncbi:hypothetical protein Tco_0375434 [Tanacetum coccineum]
MMSKQEVFSSWLFQMNITYLNQYADAQSMLQKLVSRLAILGVDTSPEDLNVKFLRSLPSEWDTHVVVWMNKPDFETMGLDDFPSSTNSINTANTGVSTGNSKVNTASAETSTASFSDATAYAFFHMAEDEVQATWLLWHSLTLRGLSILEAQVVKYKESEVLFSEEIALLKRSVGHKDYLMGLLRLNLKNQVTDKSKRGFGYTAVPSPHPLILNRPTPLDLSYSGLEEFQHPEMNGYGPRDSSLKPTNVCDRESNNSKENTDDSLTQQPKTGTETRSAVTPLKVDNEWKEKLFHPANNVRLEEPKKARENHDAPIIEDWVSDDEEEVVSIPKEEKKANVPIATKKESVKPVSPSRRSIRHMSMETSSSFIFKEFERYVLLVEAPMEENHWFKGPRRESRRLQFSGLMLLMIQQVNTAPVHNVNTTLTSPQVYTGREEHRTAESEVNTATSEGLMGPIPTTEDTQEEDQGIDLGNFHSSYAVSSTPHTKFNNEHPIDHSIYEGKTHQDLHTCLFACFLSQEEPKRVSKSLSAPAGRGNSRGITKFQASNVWVLVDLPKGHRAIGTKWVYWIATLHLCIWEGGWRRGWKMIIHGGGEGFQGKNGLKQTRELFGRAQKERRSHICYALTKKPDVYISFIKQFWRSAEASTDDNGDVQITATIDGHSMSITEASLRRHLKLDDQDGITSIPNSEIFEQLALMGYHTDSDKLTFQKGAFSPQWRFLIHNILHCLSPKKTAWEQFSSNIATAVICLATNRKYNFSRMIFEHMVSNISSPHKFFMYPRFIQICLDMQRKQLQQHSKTYPVPSLSIKVFNNMKRPTKGYSGQEVDLFPTMLDVTAPSTSPSRITSSPSHSPSPSPSPEPSPQHSSEHTTAAPTQPSPTQPSPGAEHHFPTPHDSPLHAVHSHGSDEGSLKLNELTNLVTKLSDRIGVLEDDLRKTKKTYTSAFTKLILRVKKLESQIKTGKTRRKGRIVHSDDEDIEDDSSKQGRKLSDAEVQEKASTKTEPFIQEVTPTEVIQDQGSSEKGSVEVSTAGATKGTASEVLVVSTAEENLSTAGRIVTYTRRSEEKRTRQDKGKEILIESEPKKKSKKELEQERLSFAEAIRLEEQDEEQCIDEQGLKLLRMQNCKTMGKEEKEKKL